MLEQVSNILHTGQEKGKVCSTKGLCSALLMSMETPNGINSHTKIQL